MSRFLVLSLTPFRDVAFEHETTIATSSEPWLELRFPRTIPAGKWIRLSYRASLLDHLVRPLIKFEIPDGNETETMTAPLFGKASWLGRIPDHCSRVLISPTNLPGPFTFHVEKCTSVPLALLMPRAILRSPKTAAMAIGASFINAQKETYQALRYARSGLPMPHYERWRRHNHRAYEPEGIDRGRSTTRPIHLHVIASCRILGSELNHSALIASLSSLPPDRWSCTIVRPSEDSKPGGVSDRRIRFLDPNAPIDKIIKALPTNAMIGRLELEDSLHPYALAVLAAAVERAPDAAMFYCDEESRDSDGKFTRPLLKPDWSRLFEERAEYLGSAVFWSRLSIEKRAGFSAGEFDQIEFRRLALSGTADADIRHVRRILISHNSGPVSTETEKPALPAQPAPSTHRAVMANIIIPNKDRFDLIGPCIDGILATTDHERYRIVIVDNGSTDPNVLSLYDRLRPRSNVSIIDCPGKFNYSKMSNLGASLAQDGVHIFLNNDISMPHRNWLAPLVDWAMQPNVGAVGARLLFDSGRLQHGGVTIGMGGFAGHTSHDAPGDFAGYLGRLRVSHELSAVTGACLAVGVDKFNAVTGFDEEHYPVELNDIDLCLKLTARGWKTVMCPDAELIHHQSASRGFSYRPFTRYKLERGNFKKSWLNVIRDDPYYHPAMSLFSSAPALDG